MAITGDIDHPQDAGGEIRPAPLDVALSERYLAYALSTITDRALPDARDGLKPVHRRLLHAMRELKLDPESGHKKCARIVGDVMGKYHPHGDQAIYDAMVRLAQSFAVRYPLVDGQGNFGNIDGDNPAAMRYTEARLSQVAELLLQDIDADAVPFRDTYDGSGEEPSVLPAAFPNLLANGASGIAVGMATSIPPHNIIELANALLHLIKHPRAGIETLVDHMPGPDFPTGGVLAEDRADICEAYATGRGGFRLRARWQVEREKGGGWRIAITEIPWQVQKSRLIERIAELIHERKVVMLADIKDESAEDVRILLEPKSRNVDPELLMETLFRSSDLETRISLNMNVLTDGGRTPRLINLRAALQAFLDHRHDVLVRSARHRQAKIERRLEVLSGWLICYLNLDEVIRILRGEEEPKPVLMARFDLTEVQADAILNMRLRSLRKLEEAGIRKEFAALQDELATTRALLADEGLRWKQIAGEIRGLSRTFGADAALSQRRTEIGVAPVAGPMPPEAMILREPVTVICSARGWVRTVKGHLDAADADALKYKQGDGPRFLLPAQTTDKLLLFATNGRFYTLGVDKLPGGRGHGEPLRLMVEYGNDDDIVALLIHDPERRLLVAGDDGRGFLVPERDITAQTRNGKQVLNLAAGGEAALCTPAAGDHVAVIGRNRKLLIFPLSEVSEMTRGRGVMLQKYRNSGLSDAVIFRLEDGLTWRIGSRTHTRGKADLAPWLGRRAQAGRAPPAGFPRANRFG